MQENLLLLLLLLELSLIELLMLLLFPPPTLATADAASALISLASVATDNLNIEMPPFPVVTNNIDEQEPSLANFDTNDPNTELPIVHTTPNIDEEEEQEPQFLHDDVLDPEFIRKEVMNMQPDRHLLLQTIYKREKDALINSALVVSVGKSNAITRWTVCGEDTLRLKKEYHHQIGIKGFNFWNKPVIADGKNN